MCSRHVHILPRIKAYSILLFPYLPARVRGGNNGEICRFSPHEAGGGTRQELTIKAKMPFVSSSADERKMDF